MDDRPFWRSRPYLDGGIDALKALVMGILFILLVAWLVYQI